MIAMSRPLKHKDPAAVRAKLRAPLAIQERFAKRLQDPRSGLLDGMRASFAIDGIRAWVADRGDPIPREKTTVPTDDEREKIRGRLLEHIQNATEPARMSPREARDLLQELIEDIERCIDGLNDDIANEGG